MTGRIESRDYLENWARASSITLGKRRQLQEEVQRDLGLQRCCSLSKPLGYPHVCILIGPAQPLLNLQ
jgi:hypothetical protein